MGRSRSQRAETKLAKWGDVAGQQSLLGEEATLTPEIREWREKQRNQEVL